MTKSTFARYMTHAKSSEHDRIYKKAVERDIDGY